jgi:ribosomal protein S18 acetylase RimI-like enzyme
MKGEQLEEQEELETQFVVRRIVHTRDGRALLLRPAEAGDAHGLLSALNEVAAEGRFLLRPAWALTPELEQRWLRVAANGVDLLIAVVALENDASGQEGEVAGSLSVVRGRPEYIRHTAELSMWVRPAFREAGLGSTMMEYALRWAAASGVEKITLSVRSSNRRAINLYSKYGFAEEGRRKAFVKTPEGYEDEVLLSKFVGAGHPGERSIAATQEDRVAEAGDGEE